MYKPLMYTRRVLGNMLKQLEHIRGRAQAGLCCIEDVHLLFDLVELLIRKLDEADEHDTFGSEGWKRAFDLDEE